MSPVEFRVPLIVMSALMMDGADSARARLAGTGGTAMAGCCGGSGTSLLLLENMAAGLDEICGVFHGIIIPDFVMDMRTSAAPRGTYPAQICALVDPSSHPDADRGKMTIACMNSITMIDFDHVAIAAATAGEHHHSGGGRMDHRTPGPGKINPGMESVAAREGVDTGTEAAGLIKTGG